MLPTLQIYILDGEEVKENNQIGTITSWGPLFRVSLDLIIYKSTGLTDSILSFRSGIENHGKHGNRCPAIFLKNRQLLFRSSVSSFDNYAYNVNIELDKWMKITIEQTKKDKKVDITSIFVKIFYVVKK